MLADFENPVDAKLLCFSLMRLLFVSGARISRPCRQSERPDAEGGPPGEEEEEDGPRQEEDPVQPPVRQRRPDLRPQEGAQCQLVDRPPCIVL